jgi:hypothetical protein
MLALLAGLGFGLAYSWVISPRAIIDALPRSLRADFKDQYRSAIAAAYAATGNLPRARARLALLEDADPVEALNAQAQRMLAPSAGGQQFEQAGDVAALAQALDGEGKAPAVPTATPEKMIQVGNTFTATSPAPAAEIPFVITETPEMLEMQPALSAATARPTRTATPEPGEPFALTGQETICDFNLPDGLLQILVLNPNRRQLAGIEIILTWDGGNDQFFTGLKPELGNGYADYTMTPDTVYTVQLARGSDIAQGIMAPACQTSNGEAFFGSMKLTFQQP